MATCQFCKRQFGSSQGVRAHLRFCPQYQSLPPRPSSRQPRRPYSQTAHLRQLLADAQRANPGITRPPPRQCDHTPRTSNPGEKLRPPQSGEPAQASDNRQPSTPAFRSETKPASDQEYAHNQKRQIVQQLKSVVVDGDLRWDPPIPIQAKAAVKLAIEQEFFQLPLLEIPFFELQQRAEALRENLYARYLRKKESSVSISHHREVSMPKTRLLSGLYACDRCNFEYELERVPASDAVCEACGVQLEEVADDAELDDNNDA